MKKKLFLFIIIAFLLLSSIKANASELNYDNSIGDETSIEEDFEILGIDISSYYKTSYSDYQKWYVIAMSETYVDEEKYDIQTYFYIYNPRIIDCIEDIYIYYKFSETGEEEQLHVRNWIFSEEHLLYKIKGFKYSFEEKKDIYVTKVSHFERIKSEDEDKYDEVYLKENESSFKATANHSKLNGFSVELNFNSTLVIDEYTVVEVNVDADSNLYTWWDEYWTGEKNMLVYFYNFNFPDNIKPDRIDYSKFQYDYITVERYDLMSNLMQPGKPNIIEKDNIIEEYEPGTKKIRVNKHSTELEFPTFYLGNRIKDKQFGKFDLTGQTEGFNYDCSILLCSTMKCKNTMYTGDYDFQGYRYRYTTIDKVEMLELHYTKDDVLYKCQVVNKPVDKDDFDNIEANPPKVWWEQLWEILVEIGKFVIEDIFNSKAIELVYGVVGGAVCVVGGSITITLLPHIISLLVSIIKIPFKLFDN